jgi:hypothetical protein
MSIVVFWVVTPCGLIAAYQIWRNVAYRFHLQGEEFYNEDAGGKFLRNAGNNLKDQTPSQPRRPRSIWKINLVGHKAQFSSWVYKAASTSF